MRCLYITQRKSQSVIIKKNLFLYVDSDISVSMYVIVVYVMEAQSVNGREVTKIDYFVINLYSACIREPTMYASWSH